jgi:molybdopterin converting factor small subunit
MADTITVRYRSQLSVYTGRETEQLEAATVHAVLVHIQKEFGAEAVKRAKAMLIVVNGVSIIRLKNYKTALNAGDELSFLPICGGG